MYLSVVLPSLPGAFESAARRAAALGFTHADVAALADRPAAHLDVLADTGLIVSCAVLACPSGQGLDSGAAETRRTLLRDLKRQIGDAARLGATHCCLPPGTDPSAAGLARFAEGCSLLAEYAAARMIRLCLAHVPGRALPTVAAALDWLEGLDHDNAALFLDVNHCLLSGHDPATMVAQAGSRLGYVGLGSEPDASAADRAQAGSGGERSADPIGKDVLWRLFDALTKAGYDGALALELDFAERHAQQKALLQQLVSGALGA